ncbi:hypothetical protein NP233_g6909 [Leucocoprinus birnbaumii]|uniref:Uncharacterized protein n=1 Tax=Leucocoprinus birnbaumii TaxID=56174 RepID=A0AAD5VQ68_9AGAR|nr:hypothetical protein NP233_g6909 [Leucocoprinus birnbaumii]
MYIWVIWYCKPRGVLSPIRLEFRVKREPKEEVVLDHPPPNPSMEPNTSSSDTRSGVNSVTPESTTLPSNNLNSPNLHQNSNLQSSTTNRPTVMPPASVIEIVDDQDSSGESNALPVEQQISITPPTSEEPAHKPSMSWLAGQIHNYTDVREEIGPRRRLVLDAPFLIYLFFLCIVRSAWKTMENVDTKVHVRGRDLAIKYQVGRLRVPMFYADRMDNDKNAYLPLLLAQATVGGILMISWSAMFTTPHEKLLWRVAALWTVGEPFFLLPLTRIDSYHGLEWLELTVGMAACLSILGCAVCRVLLLYMSFHTLLRLPERFSQDTPWTQFVPHL